MIKLIKADLYKETRKKSFLITILLIIFASILYICVNRNAIKENTLIEVSPYLTESEYKNINKYGNYEKYKEEYDDYFNEMSSINKTNAHKEYTKSQSILEKSTALFYLLGIIVIFNSFHSISYDLKSKTIRYMFQSSHKRETILLSKVITQMLLTILYMIIITLTMLTTTYLLTLEPFSIFKYLCLISKYIIPLLFMNIFTFTLCLITNASNLTTFISIIVYLFSLTFTNMLLSRGYTLVEYTFLPYLDYTFFEDIASILETNLIYNTSITAHSGLIVCLLYSIAFIIIDLKIIKKDM